MRESLLELISILKERFCLLQKGQDSPKNISYQEFHPILLLSILRTSEKR